MTGSASQFSGGAPYFLQDRIQGPVQVIISMMFSLMLAQGSAAALPGGRWSFVVLVLLIVVVTVFVTDGSKNKDK